MVVVVVTIDGVNKATEDKEDVSSPSSFSSSYSTPRDDYGVRMLSWKLGTSCIRKYNASIDDAVRADDTYAVTVMIGCRDRSMIDKIYKVAEYLGCKNNRHGCIDDILSLSEDEYEKKRMCHYIAYGAASHGHRDLVIEMIRRGNLTNLNRIASGAASHGHMDIVMEMMDSYDAYDSNWIAYSAANNGHMDIVTAMIRRGADNWNGIASTAAIGGHDRERR